MINSYVLVALVAAIAIVSVVLVVFRAINIGGCADGQPACAGACCQPNETCADGSCQTKPPPPDSGSCVDPEIVCHISSTVDRCCKPDACKDGVACCSESGDNIWCETAKKCCARGKCASSGDSCCDGDQIACGLTCCDAKQCSKDTNCCTGQQIRCQSADSDVCCDKGSCNALTGVCCPSAYDESRGCVQVCGPTGSQACDFGSTCFTAKWDRAAAEKLYPYCSPTGGTQKGTNCISHVDGNTVYLCLAKSSCSLNMSDAIPFPPAVSDFKPAYVFETGKRSGLPGVHAPDQPPDCYTDTLGKSPCAIDDLLTRFTKGGDDAGNKSIAAKYRDEMGESLRTALQSPLGFRCVGDKTGWRWLFKNLPETCSDDDARQACMKAAIAESDITRVFFDTDKKICALEKCVGARCESENPIQNQGGPLGDPVAPASVSCPIVADQCEKDKTSDTVCPLGCFKNEDGQNLDCWATQDGSGGWQLWQPGSDKLNICAVMCNYNASPFYSGERIGVTTSANEIVIDSNKNMQPVDGSRCTPANAFEWYANDKTASLIQFEYGKWEPNKNSSTQNQKMMHPPGAPSKSTSFGKVSPWGSNLFFHWDDKDRGSVSETNDLC